MGNDAVPQGSCPACGIWVEVLAVGAMSRSRRRAGVLTGMAASVILGLSACQPASGGLSSVAVAITTDEAGTGALKQDGVDVRWLACTAQAETVDGGGRDTSSVTPSDSAVATTALASSAARPAVARVDCEGETTDGQKITISGTVTEEVSGRCVRGELSSQVDGRTVFDVNVLGDCAARSTEREGPARGTAPSGTSAPPADPPRPTVTVTVTVTAPPPGVS